MMIEPAQRGPMSREERVTKRDVSGILLLDKPVGLSSNQALQQVKRLFSARKAGHTGSLDPLASGMLPVCFGQATRVTGWLLDADKTYEVRACFGARTDTADADGQVVETSAKTAVQQDELEAALTRHRGVIEQIPPMYSAIKQQGQPLYKLARAGHEVAREPRRVHIYELELLEFDAVHPRLRVRCSKGTYIRSLVESIAAAVDSLAHVAELRRLAVGPFTDAGAMWSMDSLRDLAAAPGGTAALDRLLQPADKAVQSLPAIVLAAAGVTTLRHGQVLQQPAHGAKAQGVVRLYGPGGEFVGLGEVLPDGSLSPKRLFGAATG